MFAETPPAARRRRQALVGASIAVHVALAVVFFLMPRRAQPVEDPILPIQFVFTAPVPSIPETMRAPVPPQSLPRPKPKPRPEPRDEPQPLPPPPPPPVEAQKPLPKPIAPEPVAPPVAKIEPPRPRPVVRTGLLDESPVGPAIAASKTSRSLIEASGFDGAGNAAASRPSGGTAGVVRETGFEEEAAAVRPKREREREHAPSVGPLDSEVEILSKPKPAYTDEARTLRIEGDVVLDVTFEAAGGLRVLGVSQGLGHGLDEAAIEAATKIRFNPAKRDGRPVDHTAKLRVVFRLA